MPERHFRPPLDKRFIATHEGYDVYSVNAFAIRNFAEPDEEFTNFATHDDFPHLIAKKQIWITEKLFAREGLYFLADALTDLKRKAAGASEETASRAGLEAERALREQMTGLRFRHGRPHRRVPERIHIQPYLTLHDPEFAIHVWIIDGFLPRCYYKTDYTEGGHGYVYPWVPKNEIWIEQALDRQELAFIVTHEYLELRLMRDKGVDYDSVHAICSDVEYHLRKERGIHSLLVPGRRRLRKADLARLVNPEVFAEVVNAYLN